MRKTIIAGNWKMNGSKAMTETLLAGYEDLAQQHPELTLVAFPPFVYLQQGQQLLAEDKVGLGAQNINTEEQGAYTGEVSANMLTDVGCQYVLVGHSERRHLYQEDNDIVAKKWVMACQHGLKPVVCVGETLEDKEKNLTNQVILHQVESILSAMRHDYWLTRTIIAYEPVWAIGTGLSASNEQAQAIQQLIRQRIAEQDAEIAENMCILYGGSVKPDNAADFLQMPDIDGLLVGGASLKLESFAGICQCSK